MDGATLSVGLELLVDVRLEPIDVHVDPGPRRVHGELHLRVVVVVRVGVQAVLRGLCAYVVLHF